MESLTIIQHNVNTWTNKRLELSNAYRRLDPDIILINHTGKADPPIHMRDYAVYYSNEEDSHHRGTAIAIKKKLVHKGQL